MQFDTPGPVPVVLDIPAGRVRFIAADRSDTVVEVLPADAAQSRDAKAAERIRVAHDDGVLLIDAPASKSRLGPSGSVEITVRLPAGSRVEARTGAADVRGVGRLGDVVLEAAQGVVKLDEAASARVTVLDGDVTVGRLGGPAEISTHKDDIRVTQAVHGTVTPRTQHGDIEVGAARGVSASLDAGTGHGRVHHTLRNADGTAAGLAFHATTAYGDITARSL